MLDPNRNSIIHVHTPRQDELAYGVNRASPEEKILDFNDRMVVLTKVMRRQELLHKIFRYCRFVCVW